MFKRHNYTITFPFVFCVYNYRISNSIKYHVLAIIAMYLVNNLMGVVLVLSVSRPYSTFFGRRRQVTGDPNLDWFLVAKMSDSTHCILFFQLLSKFPKIGL